MVSQSHELRNGVLQTHNNRTKLNQLEIITPRNKRIREKLLGLGCPFSSYLCARGINLWVMMRKRDTLLLLHIASVDSEAARQRDRLRRWLALSKNRTGLISLKTRWRSLACLIPELVPTRHRPLGGLGHR